MRGNRAYGKETEALVIENIFLNGKNGISNTKLSELTGIERQIISEICKDNKDSKIKIIEKGRWRTYYPNFNAIDSLVFDKPSFFGRQLRYYFLQFKNSGFKIECDDLIQLHQKQIKYLKELKKLETIESKFEQRHALNLIRAKQLKSGKVGLIYRTRS